MRGIKTAIFAGAALSAMLAMWFMSSALNSGAQAPAPVANTETLPEVEAPKTEEILVASRAISIGTSIGPDDLRWQTWPLESVMPFHYTQSDNPEAIGDLEGSASRLPIHEGEPLSTEKIIDLEGSGVMASLLRNGMRAVAVPLSDVTGAGGFILPGDFVDLLLTRQVSIEEINPETGEIEKTNELNQTDTVMKTVRVVAIDQQLNDEGAASASGNTATLEVLPEQAELITLTRQIAKQDRGFITLSLRSFGEMIDEYGDGLDRVLPSTVLDLREVVRQKAERAKKLQEQYKDFQERRQREIAEEKARREAEEVRKAEEERLRALLAAELEAEAAELARIEAELGAAGVEIDTTQESGVQIQQKPQLESIVVIRNGAPTVVQTLSQPAGQ